MTNQEPIKAAGQVATTLAEGLKSQPILIGFLLITVVFMALVYVQARDTRKGERENMRVMIEKCIPILNRAELLKLFPADGIPPNASD
jgi:hypothetical protein